MLLRASLTTRSLTARGVSVISSLALLANLFLFSLVALAPTSTTAFYLPGVAPRAYKPGEALPLLVNRLDSTEELIPFDYYFFDFCEPGEHALPPAEGETHPPHIGASVSENLGQVLMGERIRHSPYQVGLFEGKVCEPLCHRHYDPQDKESMTKFKLIERAIRKDYMHHWIMDNLPAVECTAQCRGGKTREEQPYYRLGFPVGCALGDAEKSLTLCTANNIINMYPEEVFINNHVDIVVKYHESDEFEGTRVVGIEIQPRSLGHRSPSDLDCSAGAPPQTFSMGADGKQKAVDVTYTYSVYFHASDLKWASRWDAYLSSSDGVSIHWFSIINSLIIVVFLTGMVGVILFKTLHKDIARYNQAEQDAEEAQEEFGWKLVHGDVFRAPNRSMLLAVCLGSGAQVILMFLVTLFFACLGFLSPATRGGFMTSAVVLWVCLGTPAGYYSSRMYKMFNGLKWKTNIFLTALVFPGLIFAIFFSLNLVLWSEQSSAAVPFGTLCALAALWFFISIPLVFVGAYMGFGRKEIEHPVRTNPIPRQIPPQALLQRAIPSMIMGGVLPFGCIFIQLFFLLNSLWGHRVYYMFGFLLVVFAILAVTTVESTILLCYFHLCSENYRWWWRAFLTGGASTVYLFVYALIFYFRRMEVDGTANLVLYFGYTLIASIMYWLATGTLGFYGCYMFVRKIYGVIKVD